MVSRRSTRRSISGTQNNAGGSYSPFYLRILREDGEQEITRFSTTLPPGLTGNLTGIPFCPEADIEAARGVTGQEEEEHPSCPAASEIGHTIVGAGVGTRARAEPRQDLPRRPLQRRAACRSSRSPRRRSARSTSGPS